MLLLSLRVSLLILIDYSLYLLFLIFVGYFIIEGLAVNIDFFWIASCDFQIKFQKFVEGVRGLFGQLYLCNFEEFLIICGQFAYSFFEKFKGRQDMLSLKCILHQIVLLTLAIIDIPLVEQILLNTKYFPDQG